MNLFSEIYNHDYLQMKELFIKNEKISPDFHQPFSDYQKSWLKAVLSDEKIHLFLDDEEIASLKGALSDVDEMFSDRDFNYYDRFTDKDNYSSAAYIRSFRRLLSAIKSHSVIKIDYITHNNEIRSHHCYPLKLEYSVKNDKFRLLGYFVSDKNYYKSFSTINLSRILLITDSDRTLNSVPDINDIIRKNYYLEPVTIIISNERNALERTMLSFSSYEKNTKRLPDGTYECTIYYNRSDETELLIEVLSFGPAIKVTGNDRFLKLLKERLSKQKILL